MTNALKNVVLIVPADHKATAEAVSTLLGYQPPGEQTYTIGLSQNGQSPATHYACHVWAQPQFLAMIEAGQAQQGLPLAPWEAAGTNEAAVYAMCASLIVSVREDGQHQSHFADVLAASGLTRVMGDVLQ